MNHNFEEIVNEWYRKLWPRCLRVLARACPSLSLEEARNVYQDAFLAVYDNIHNGRVAENTVWDNYIIRVCVNLGCKALRKSSVTDSISEQLNDFDSTCPAQRRIDTLLSLVEDTPAIYDDIEVQALIGEELNHTPEPCASIIKMYYYADMPMARIAEELGLKNANTAKSRKCQCMNDLTSRIASSLQRAGFDAKIQKKKS